MIPLGIRTTRLSDILSSLAFLLLVFAFFLYSFDFTPWDYVLTASLGLLGIAFGIKLCGHTQRYAKDKAFKLQEKLMSAFRSEFFALVELNLTFLISLPLFLEVILLIWFAQNPEAITDILTFSPVLSILLPFLVLFLTSVSIGLIRVLMMTVLGQEGRADKLSGLSNALCAFGAIYTALTASFLGVIVFALGTLTGVLSWLAEPEPQERRWKRIARIFRRLGTMAFAALLVSIIFVPLSVEPQYYPDVAEMTEHSLSALAHTAKSYQLISHVDDLDFAIWSSLFHRLSGLRVTSNPPDLTFAEAVSTLTTIEQLLQNAAYERRLAKSHLTVFISSSRQIADRSPRSYELIYSLHQDLSRIWSDNLDLQDAVGRFLFDEAQLLIRPDPEALGNLDKDKSVVLEVIGRAKSDYDNSQLSLKAILDLTLFAQAIEESDIGVRVDHSYTYLIVATNYTMMIGQRVQSAQSLVNSLGENGNVTKARQLVDEAQLYVTGAEKLLEEANKASFASYEQRVAIYKAAIGNATIAAGLLQNALELLGAQIATMQRTNYLTYGKPTSHANVPIQTNAPGETALASMSFRSTTACQRPDESSSRSVKDLAVICSSDFPADMELMCTGKLGLKSPPPHQPIRHNTFTQMVMLDYPVENLESYLANPFSFPFL